MPAPSKRIPLPTMWRYQLVGAASGLAIGPCEDKGANAGQIPQYCQTITGNKPPDYWCCSFCVRAGDRGLKKASPFLRTASCDQMRAFAKKRGALKTRAEFDALRKAAPIAVAGWLCLLVKTLADGSLDAHHIAIVGMIDDDTGELVVNGPGGGFFTIEGNAANPRKPASRNGDGAYDGRERGTAGDKTTYEFVATELL